MKFETEKLRKKAHDVTLIGGMLLGGILIVLGLIERDLSRLFPGIGLLGLSLRESRLKNHKTEAHTET